MPSQLHQILLQPFRDRPTLAAALLHDSLHKSVPEFTEVRIEEADFTQVVPTEYRVDLVLLLRQKDKPVLGLVLESQLSIDADKDYAWPAYVVNLRARHKCPVTLLVLTHEDRVLRWAQRPLVLGDNGVFTPLVLDRSRVPKVTDLDQARQQPELALLSVIFHGQDSDTALAAQIGLAAHAGSATLDPERQKEYADRIWTLLSKAAREELETMGTFKHEYQSDFARRYVAEGETKGRAALILMQLAQRFGVLSESVHERINKASIEELDAIGKRLLEAKSLQEALRAR